MTVHPPETYLKLAHEKAMTHANRCHWLKDCTGIVKVPDQALDCSKALGLLASEWKCHWKRSFDIPVRLNFFRDAKTGQLFLRMRRSNPNYKGASNANS